MTDKLGMDAQTLRKLVREAEAISDEAMIAFARLEQAMLIARQNPAVPVDIGQRAIVRLTQAESQATAMSSNLFRVHRELNQVALTIGGLDHELITPLESHAPGRPASQRSVPESV